MAYYDLNKLYPFYHVGTMSPIPPYEEYNTNIRSRFTMKLIHSFADNPIVSAITSSCDLTPT